MFWRLLPIYWLVLVLDLRCTAFEKSTNIKTKNNGKIDPFSFEVFHSSQDDDFGKFSQNEEDDPDMAIFFKDMDFFDDDDDDESFYKSPFGGENMTIKDFFSKTLEESRNQYKEDVSNIDKMFKRPGKSNIDELLNGETTREGGSSKNLNSSERNSVLNTNTERNGSVEGVRHTTKRSVDTQTNSLNTQIPLRHLVNSENPPKANNSLFSDVRKAASNSVATKLASMQEKYIKDDTENGEKQDGNRESRDADINEELLGLQRSNSENSILKSSNVVTEISVQETVNGHTIERKPSSEELRLIENKILGFPIQNTKEQASKTNSQEPEYYDDVDYNGQEIINRTKISDEKTGAQIEKLPNGVIDDLSSLLKVDPSFVDDDMDQILVDDEEIQDMDSILSDKGIEHNNSNEINRNKNEEINKNTLANNKNNNEERSTEEKNNAGGKEDPKNLPSSPNGNGEDPRDYVKIFHTEHKNSSNVSDVKITFSETEGDFLDDDEDDSEYSSEVTEKPNVVDEKTISKDNKESNTQLNAVVEHNDTLEDYDEESLITEASILQTNSDLSKTKKERFYQNSGVQNKITTILNNVVVTELPEIIESPGNTDKYIQRNQYRNTDFSTEKVDADVSTEFSQPATNNIFVTEDISSFTEKEEMIENNPRDESTNPTESSKAVTQYADNISNFKAEKKRVISSQNINASMQAEQSTTESYNEFEDLATFIPEISFTTINPKEDMDDIDRAFALIKNILAESGSTEENTVGTTLQKQEDITKSSSDLLSLQETITIPLDTSTMPIDTSSHTEDFIDTSTDFKEIYTTTMFLNKDYSAVKYSTTEPNLYLTSTVQTGAIIGESVSDKDTDVMDNTTPILATTTIANNAALGYDSETQSSGIDLANTYASNVVNVKVDETTPYEFSSSEVASMYNTRIEEYESLEDNSDISLEDGAIFGTKEKEYEIKISRGEGQKEYGDLYSKTSRNTNDGEVLKRPNTNIIFPDDKEILDHDNDLVPLLRGIVLNGSAEFSLKISTQDEIFYVPASAEIREHPNIINITWRTNEYLNNSIAMRILETQNFYTIKEVMINLLTGNTFIKQKKLVAVSPDPVLDNSISGSNRVVKMKDGTTISFSNVDFLRKNYESLEYSEASMRERRLWHIEIAFICLAVVALIAIVLYVVAVKTKRKITLREKNELAQVTHC